jgi:hypothetical protein
MRKRTGRKEYKEKNREDVLLSSSFTFVTSSFLSSSFKSPLHYLFHYFLIIMRGRRERGSEEDGYE